MFSEVLRAVFQDKVKAKVAVALCEAVGLMFLQGAHTGLTKYFPGDFLSRPLRLG